MIQEDCVALTLFVLQITFSSIHLVQQFTLEIVRFGRLGYKVASRANHYRDPHIKRSSLSLSAPGSKMFRTMSTSISKTLAISNNGNRPSSIRMATEQGLIFHGCPLYGPDYIECFDTINCSFTPLSREFPGARNIASS